MKLTITKNYDEMSQRAFEIIREAIEKKDSPCISFTTGGTPKGIFALLVDAVNNGLDISRSTFLNLDEYVGNPDAVFTVKTFMYSRLYNLINRKPENIFMLNGGAEDREEEIKRYKEILDKYPRDIQLLGLGVNGHIGANEPGTPFDSTIFCAKHKESTIKSTIDLYGLKPEEAPSEMFTMGFKEIMDAKTVLLVASGKSKAEAVKRLLEGEISEECPASFLRTHENFIFIIDEDAASLLEKGDI